MPNNVYGVGGYKSVMPSASSGIGIPTNIFGVELGQAYFDKSTSPYTEYVFNGIAWVLALVANAGSSSGAAASPVVVNGRSGAATFTSVSIAAAADLTLTITNSAIVNSSTQVLYSLAGATTGSALTIKSVTNSAGSSAVVVTNGTGATTTTANITLTFLVLN